ncbi:MAG: type IV pilin N-terminal domain-containing protein [Nitrososphaerota archaeon]|nr:type IV pilin N-terminal domain-containing protein [Nitrososphaerota archaeon]
MKISGRQRNGISPIIATVLIIAATLIAFAAVAGYIFGLFGSSTKSAQAQVVSESLASGVLTVSFTNNGGQAVTVQTASVTVGSTTWTAGSLTSSVGATYSTGTATAGTASVVPATTTTVYFATWYGGTATPFVSGTTYTFTLALSNGITSTVTATAS